LVKSIPEDLLDLKRKVVKTIQQIRPLILPVFHVEYQSGNIPVIDLSEHHNEFVNVDINDVHAFSAAVFRKINETGSMAGIGRYNENRSIYRRFKLFQGEEPRIVHLGIDLWIKAGTRVFAPLSGKIHSFKYNAKEGDYGPTLILEHTVKDVTFYTLYGHLSLDSIENCQEGDSVQAGEEIARVGNFPINGNWPPHLHFQLITSMQGWKGDFPGAASIADRIHWLNISPDPNLILNIKTLTT